MCLLQHVRRYCSLRIKRRPEATKNWAGPASFPFRPASFSSFSCLEIFKDEIRPVRSETLMQRLLLAAILHLALTGTPLNKGKDASVLCANKSYPLKPHACVGGVARVSDACDWSADDTARVRNRYARFKKIYPVEKSLIHQIIIFKLKLCDAMWYNRTGPTFHLYGRRLFGAKAWTNADLVLIGSLRPLLLSSTNFSPSMNM